MKHLRKKKLLEKVVAEEKYGLKGEKLGQPGKAGLYTGLFYITEAIVPHSILLKTTCAICSSIILHNGHAIARCNGFHSGYYS